VAAGPAGRPGRVIAAAAESLKQQALPLVGAVAVFKLGADAARKGAFGQPNLPEPAFERCGPNRSIKVERAADPGPSHASASGFLPVALSMPLKSRRDAADIPVTGCFVDRSGDLDPPFATMSIGENKYRAIEFGSARPPPNSRGAP